MIKGCIIPFLLSYQGIVSHILQWNTFLHFQLMFDVHNGVFSDHLCVCGLEILVHYCVCTILHDIHRRFGIAMAMERLSHPLSKSANV